MCRIGSRVMETSSSAHPRPGENPSGATRTATATSRKVCMGPLPLVPQMFIKVRAMGRRVAPGAEAGAPIQVGGVATLAHGWEVRLGMAAKAQVAVPDDQHLVMHRAMHLVAGGASLPQGLVLPDKGAPLVLVALEARLIDPFQRRGRPRPDLGPVRLVAIGAAHLAFEHRVVVVESEFGLLIQVAGEAGAGIFPRIDD